VGQTAMPAPLDEQDWDGWLFWTPLVLVAHTTSPTDDPGGLSTIIRVDVDSKAMRKLNLGDVIFASAQFTEVGAAVARVFFDSRILIKLP